VNVSHPARMCMRVRYGSKLNRDWHRIQMPLLLLATRLGKLSSFVVSTARRCRQEGDAVSRCVDSRVDVMTEVGRLLLITHVCDERARSNTVRCKANQAETPEKMRHNSA
jgi:hypothetical protein